MSCFGRRARRCGMSRRRRRARVGGLRLDAGRADALAALYRQRGASTLPSDCTPTRWRGGPRGRLRPLGASSSAACSSRAARRRRRRRWRRQWWWWWWRRRRRRRWPDARGLPLAVTLLCSAALCASELSRRSRREAGASLLRARLLEQDEHAGGGVSPADAPRPPRPRRARGGRYSSRGGGLAAGRGPVRAVGADPLVPGHGLWHACLWLGLLHVVASLREARRRGGLHLHAVRRPRAHRRTPRAPALALLRRPLPRTAHGRSSTPTTTSRRVAAADVEAEEAAAAPPQQTTRATTADWGGAVATKQRLRCWRGGAGCGGQRCGGGAAAAQARAPAAVWAVRAEAACGMCGACGLRGCLSCGARSTRVRGWRRSTSPRALRHQRALRWPARRPPRRAARRARGLLPARLVAAAADREVLHGVATDRILIASPTPSRRARAAQAVGLLGVAAPRSGRTRWRSYTATPTAR